MQAPAQGFSIRRFVLQIRKLCDKIFGFMLRSGDLRVAIQALATHFFQHLQQTGALSNNSVFSRLTRHGHIHRIRLFQTHSVRNAATAQQKQSDDR
jgi:hypothetical protein